MSERYGIMYSLPTNTGQEALCNNSCRLFFHSPSINTGGGRGGMMSFGVERKDNLGAREALYRMPSGTKMVVSLPSVPAC